MVFLNSSDGFLLLARQYDEAHQDDGAEYQHTGQDGSQQAESYDDVLLAVQ